MGKAAKKIKKGVKKVGKGIGSLFKGPKLPKPPDEQTIEDVTPPEPTNISEQSRQANLFQRRRARFSQGRRANVRSSVGGVRGPAFTTQKTLLGR